MRLAKPRIDVGLSTNRVDALLPFWQGEIGAVFDHLLPIRRGQDQYRHDIAGSVLKINSHDEPVPATPPSGYVELLVARAGLEGPVALSDPDGNRVTLVPPGFDGVTQIGVRLAVRDVDAHRRFYVDALGLTEESVGVFRAGESVILCERDATAPADADMRGLGWRYITFQVFKVDEEHAASSLTAAAKRSPRSRWAPRRGSRWSAIPTGTGSSCRNVPRSSAPSTDRSSRPGVGHHRPEQLRADPAVLPVVEARGSMSPGSRYATHSSPRSLRTGASMSVPRFAKVTTHRRPSGSS